MLRRGLSNRQNRRRLRQSLDCSFAPSSLVRVRKHPTRTTISRHSLEQPVRPWAPIVPRIGRPSSRLPTAPTVGFARSSRLTTARRVVPVGFELSERTRSSQ